MSPIFEFAVKGPGFHVGRRKAESEGFRVTIRFAGLALPKCAVIRTRFQAAIQGLQTRSGLLVRPLLILKSQ
jgi:hypothetical protein